MESCLNVERVSSWWRNWSRRKDIDIILHPKEMPTSEGWPKLSDGLFGWSQSMHLELKCDVDRRDNEGAMSNKESESGEGKNE